jgi:hypothetical protein
MRACSWGELLVWSLNWGIGRDWFCVPVYYNRDVIWSSWVREVGVDVAAAALMRLTCGTWLRHFQRFRKRKELKFRTLKRRKPLSCFDR